MGRPRTICPTYWIKDRVYLIVDTGGEAGIVTGVTARQNDSYAFLVAWGHGCESEHYDFELSRTPNYGNEPAHEGGEEAEAE